MFVLHCPEPSVRLQIVALSSDSIWLISVCCKPKNFVFLLMFRGSTLSLMDHSHQRAAEP